MLAVTLLFVAWASAVVGVLQRSRNAVHLRSGAPIVGIAWVHSLTKLEFLQAGGSTVDTGHGDRDICGGWEVQCSANWCSCKDTLRTVAHTAACLFKRQLVPSAAAPRRHTAGTFISNIGSIEQVMSYYFLHHVAACYQSAEKIR